MHRRPDDNRSVLSRFFIKKKGKLHFWDCWNSSTEWNKYVIAEGRLGSTNLYVAFSIRIPVMLHSLKHAVMGELIPVHIFRSDLNRILRFNITPYFVITLGSTVSFQL